jgi:hypothetical protein
MKVYLLDAYNRGSRYFTDEKALISYLNTDNKRGEPIHKYQLRVLEAELELTTNGSSYLETYEKSTREQNQREAKLKAVLGDEYAIAVDNLLTYIKENAKESIMKEKFFESVSLVAIEKKEFSKFASKKSSYLLYEVSDTVEYYKLLLAVHNFRKMEDRYYAVRYDQYGREFNEGGWTKPLNKTNFLKAKELNKKV